MNRQKFFKLLKMHKEEIQRIYGKTIFEDANTFELAFYEFKRFISDSGLIRFDKSDEELFEMWINNLQMP